MEIKDILLVVFPFISGIISAGVTYFFTLRVKKNENMLKFKEERYVNLVILLQGFVGNTTSDQMKKKFFEEQYKSWLYAPDSVVNSINNMVKFLISENGKIPNPQKWREIIGDIILEMRKDLWGNTKLGNIDFRYTNVN